MANKKFEEEQRRLLEKRELLKLRQGIVEESEIIEQPKSEEKPKLKGWKKVENFFYHYKWHVVGISFAVLLLGFMTIQTIMREQNDLYVLLVSTTNDTGLYAKCDDISEALERYCPDYDNNGYVHVGVNFINLSPQIGNSQYYDAENMKYTSEIATGDSQMYIGDTGVADMMYEMGKGKVQYFQLLSEQYPDATFSDGQGLQLNTTEFIDLARWSSCPDKVCVYVRGEYENMTANSEEAKEQRRRANEVLDNIINGNIINPTPDEKQ